jgi:hypothetical protein
MAGYIADDEAVVGAQQFERCGRILEFRTVGRMLIVEMILVYWLGALSGPAVARWTRRMFRRARRRSGGWDGYFQG